MKKKREAKNIPCLSDKPCDGHLILKRVDYTIALKDRTVSVPDIEVWECDSCKERFYPYEASKKIDLYKEYSGRLMLRIAPDIHWTLVRIARRHHRSLNQEISYLIENSLKEHGGFAAT